MSRMFEWVDLPDGRARFSGGSGGGADELAHDTFAVDLDGRVLFGEVRERYDGTRHFLQVPTFGYAFQSRVGIDVARTALDETAVLRTQRLAAELYDAVAAYDDVEDKPVVMRLVRGTTYSGEVRFDADWVVLAPAGVDA